MSVLELEHPTYHDLHITTASIPRTSIFDLPYNLMVTCTRAGGWELWADNDEGRKTHLAGEYSGDEKWLVLDVDGHVIVDSRRHEQPEPEETPQAVS